MNELMEEIISRDFEKKDLVDAMRQRFERDENIIFPLENEEKTQLCIATLLDDDRYQSSAHQLFISDCNFESVKRALPEKELDNHRITVYIAPECAGKAEELEKNGMQVRVVTMPCNTLPSVLLSDFSKRFRNPCCGCLYEKRSAHIVLLDDVEETRLCVPNAHIEPSSQSNFLRTVQRAFRTFFKESVPLSEWQKNKVITKQNIPFPNNAERGRGARED